MGNALFKGGTMFKLKENNTNVKQEFLAGLTTFSAMAYILMVNADMFMAIEGNPVTYGAIYVSTALASVIGCLLIGLMSNLPLAQAPAMGLNAFFVFTVCNQFHFTYANALLITLFDGIIFVILTATGMRKLIFEAIPLAVKTAISAGIGLFIAFIGLQNVHFVVGSPSTLVDLHSFNMLFGSTTWADIMPILVMIFTLVLITALTVRKVRGSIFLGMIGGTVLYYFLGLLTVPGFTISLSSNGMLGPIKEFMDLSFLKVFSEGFDFSKAVSIHGAGTIVIILLTCTLSLAMVDMFDTLGTLYGACEVGGLLDEEGNVPNMEKAMLSDAIATCIGTLLGNSTVSSFVESASGVAEGGRTGLSSIFTAMFFVIAIFFAPIATIIPSCATSAVLVYVGILMIGCVAKVDWTNQDSALPAFMTIAVMPLTYNISYGIAFGLLTYILVKLLANKRKDINLGTWILGVLFTLMFFVA